MEIPGVFWSNPTSWGLVKGPGAAGPWGMICTLCCLGAFNFKHKWDVTFWACLQQQGDSDLERGGFASFLMERHLGTSNISFTSLSCVSIISKQKIRDARKEKAKSLWVWAVTKASSFNNAPMWGYLARHQGFVCLLHTFLSRCPSRATYLHSRILSQNLRVPKDLWDTDRRLAQCSLSFSLLLPWHHRAKTG